MYRISQPRLVLPALAALIAAIAVIIMLSPAAAAHDDGGPFHMEHHCQAGEVCLFEAIDYDHGYKGFSGDSLNYWWLDYLLTDDGHTHRLNDTSTSIDNDGNSCGSRHYEHSNHGGASFWLARGDAIAGLGAWSDRLTSHKWC